MPSISIFIDEKLYREITELISKKVANTEQEIFLIALKLLSKIVHTCEESKVKIDECFDKIVDYIFAK